MKIGDLVKIDFNNILAIIISDVDQYGWFEVLDINGRHWECSTITLEIVDEGG
tara:strand:- start:887 stop:1045 length:159 start_codon:yes stop_codon:yes gene_type:complete